MEGEGGEEVEKRDEEAGLAIDGAVTAEKSGESEDEEGGDVSLRRIVGMGLAVHVWSEDWDTGSNGGGEAGWWA